MRKNEFFDYIESHILEKLGPEYQDASVEVKEVRKSNDTVLHGLTIINGESPIVPVIYLEDFYNQYQEGTHVGTIMEKIAEIRVKSENPSFDINYQEFTDFEKMKDHIRVRICDPELNAVRLEDLVAKPCGDFTATYYLNIFSNNEGVGSVNINHALLDRWGITPEQLDTTALANEMQAEPTLMNIKDVIENMMFGDEEPINYLLTDRKADIGGMDVPMFCLTNGEKTLGASLIVHPGIREKIADVVGGDFYVIPSSQHEVLIIPDSADITVNELSEMVVSVNATEVSPQDLLSDKVQHYSAHTRTLENAREYEAKVKADPEAYGKTKETPVYNEPSLCTAPII